MWAVETVDPSASSMVDQMVEMMDNLMVDTSASSMVDKMVVMMAASMAAMMV